MTVPGKVAVDLVEALHKFTNLNSIDLSFNDIGDVGVLNET
jgi:hypothetical protein